MSEKNTIEKRCYVCGLQLDEYPYEPDTLTYNHSVICPACGIHYGYDDGGAGDIVPEELTDQDWKFGDEAHKKIIKFWRQRWIEQGMKWWSPQPQPQGWEPKKQLEMVPEEFK
ncbi:MAG: hypothetical protein V4665_02490 [Patescibacteria group bacterium]